MKIYILNTNILPKSGYFDLPNELTKKAEIQTFYGRKLLDYVLSKEYGIENPTIFHNAHGKPYIKNGNVFFNISHSGNFAVCAVSDSECGIDIEVMRDYKDNTARRICNEKEYALITNADNKATEFLKIWTKKEAYLKCVGTGLSVLLSSVDTIDNPNFETVQTDYYILSTYSDSDTVREYKNI